MRDKSAQQEMVGFILIVVLVIVALMVFLVISMNKPLVSVESKSTQSLMSSVLSYTTDCIVSEPYRMNIMELMIGCYEDKKCVNMNKMACAYLNETLSSVMKSLIATDPTIVAYRIETYWQEGEEKPDAFYRLTSGTCVGGTGAKLQGEIQPLDNELKVLLELCTESNS
ncbi:MAG: hypothetical protein WCI72_05540 [archaeon]